MNFGFDWPNGFREDEIIVIYMYIASGQGQKPVGVILFSLT